MPAQLVSIAHLLLAIALLQLGSGLQGLLIPVRGQIAGFPPLCHRPARDCILLGIRGRLRCGPAIIRRVGHIRAFSGSLRRHLYVDRELAQRTRDGGAM